MIEKIRTYIATCPFLDQFSELNVEYLVDRINAYSINEGVSYNPILSKDILGNEDCQFQFTFDARLYWNDEIANNVDNSIFFENFREWLRNNDKNKIFPQIEGVQVESISAITNGYLFATNSDEAIYRISCVMKYWRSNETNNC